MASGFSIGGPFCDKCHRPASVVIRHELPESFTSREIVLLNFLRTPPKPTEFLCEIHDKQQRQ